MKIGFTAFLTIFLLGNAQGQVNNQRECVNRTEKIEPSVDLLLDSPTVDELEFLKDGTIAAKITDYVFHTQTMLIWQENSYRWIDLTKIFDNSDYFIDKNGNIVIYANRKLMRYTPDLSIDSSFGQNGVVDFSRIDDLKAFQLDFRLITSDSKGNIYLLDDIQTPDTYVYKLTASGDLDLSFNKTGFIIYPTGFWSYIFGISVDNNDNLIVIDHLNKYEHQFLLHRYLSNGDIDPLVDGHLFFSINFDFLPMEVVLNGENLLLLGKDSHWEYQVLRIIRSDIVDTNFKLTFSDFKPQKMLIDGDNLFIVGFDDEHNLVLQQNCLRGYR